MLLSLGPHHCFDSKHEKHYLVKPRPCPYLYLALESLDFVAQSRHFHFLILTLIQPKTLRFNFILLAEALKINIYTSIHQNTFRLIRLNIGT